MKRRSVAITGAGAVTALGNGTAALLAALDGNRSGLREGGNAEEAPWLRFAGRVADAGIPDDLEPRQRAQAKFLNRSGAMAYLAAREAMAGAPGTETVPPPRRSLYVATGDHTNAGCPFLYEAIREASGGRFDRIDPERYNQAVLDRVNPFYLLDSLHNNPFSFLSAAFSCMGPGTSLASHSPAGANALELAFRSVRAGRADLALVSGSGSWVAPLMLFELHRLGLLSRGRNGAASYRPFDARRDGFLAGEGAAALRLEPLETARERGARILAVMEGVGNASSSESLLTPSPQGLSSALRTALADAGRQPGEVGLFLAHGSGTPRGDLAELQAFRDVFGALAPAVPLAALKPLTGHMGAASDLAELVAGIHFLQAGAAPGLLNFHRAPAGFEDLGLSPDSRPVAAKRLLSLRCGLGGQASAAVLTTELPCP